MPSLSASQRVVSLVLSNSSSCSKPSGVNHIATSSSSDFVLSNSPLRDRQLHHHAVSLFLLNNLSRFLQSPINHFATLSPSSRRTVSLLCRLSRPVEQSPPASCSEPSITSLSCQGNRSWNGSICSERRESLSDVLYRIPECFNLPFHCLIKSSLLGLSFQGTNVSLLSCYLNSISPYKSMHRMPPSLSSC